MVSVIWNYDGFAPQEMSDRIVTVTERSIIATVNDIEHTESQSYYGIGVIKLFFRPAVTIARGLAQVTSICQGTALRRCRKCHNVSRVVKPPWPGAARRPRLARGENRCFSVSPAGPSAPSGLRLLPQG